MEMYMSALESIVVQQTAEQRINPLIRKARLPGETFAIPSKGLLYKPGVLSHDVSNGELHIYPMTAIDELVMKSADKLFSGEAIRETFQRCIPQVLEPNKLFAKDVDFLLTALRKVSYGPNIEVTFTHTCKDAKENSYEVPLDKFLRTTQVLNPISLESRFKFDCDGQIVIFKPATYEDLIQLNQIQQAKISNSSISDKERLRDIMFSLSAVIDGVDGINDRDMIIEWLYTLPIQTLGNLSAAIEKISDWGVSFDVDLVCKDCGEKISVPTNLNPISFFI